MLSVIIPAYNEEEYIRKVCLALDTTLAKNHIDYEMIFVDDGSADNTAKEIDRLVFENKNICGIHFSRNFGKDAAIYAGLEKARGRCCVIMDCDLQHPPEKIPEMYNLWKSGYEIVEGVKTRRGKESKIKALCAKTFYQLMSNAVHTDMHNASDFKLLDKKVVDVLIAMPEKKAFFRGLSSWVGFKKTTVGFEVKERVQGNSKWSVTGLIRYAAENITAFSDAPLKIMIPAGGAMISGALFVGICSAFFRINSQILSALIMLSGGIILLSLGIIGLYLKKLCEELNGRPRYIISEICDKRNRQNPF